jgi:YD repeat-containing protein
MTEFDPTTIPLGYTYDENGNQLTYRDSEGFWWEYTYDADGNVLTFRNSEGYWWEW